jgi:hypothetical protein
VLLRSLFLVVSTLILPLSASAENVILSAKLGNWSFSTDNVRGRPESQSGFGAYSFEMGYSFFPKILGVVGANLLLSEGFSGNSGFGFDVGFRYYPITDATQSITKTENVSIEIQEKLRPYLGLFFRQRDFNIALQSGYVGPGLCIGLDYNYAKTWHFGFEARYDTLYGSGDGTATQTNFLIGIGIEL